MGHEGNPSLSRGAACGDRAQRLLPRPRGRGGGGRAGRRPVRAYVVHQETTFDANEVRRHVTVLVLTGNRLLVCHTDEHRPRKRVPDAVRHHDHGVGEARAGSRRSWSAGSSPTRSRTCPATLPRRWPDHRLGRRLPHRPGAGRLRRPELRGRPRLHRRLTADDLSLRVSEAGDGPEAVRQALAFAQALSEATARTSRRDDRPIAATRDGRPGRSRPSRDRPGPRSDLLADRLRRWPAGQQTPLGLAPADRDCVFLVDGLGWELLARPPGRGALPVALAGSPAGAAHRRLPRDHRHLPGLGRHRPAAGRARHARLPLACPAPAR